VLDIAVFIIPHATIGVGMLSDSRIIKKMSIRNFRFSGHETFPCRYAWLPKAYVALQESREVFASEEAAMVTLGLGKNMVRACRFWVQATGVALPAEGGYALTDFGIALLDPHQGFDPYLEDVRTLWLLHWQLSSGADEPLFAWDYMLNRWQHPDITRTAVMDEFVRETRRMDRKLSVVTLEQHFDTFLHTYVPTRSRKGDVQEDNLDCPLVELELIQKCGERPVDASGKREVIYAFRREAKPEITPELFIYCLNDFWDKQAPNEMTLNFRDVAVSHGSPGQLFKLPEWDVRERLDTIAEDSVGVFRYQDSASQPQVSRSTTRPTPTELLVSVYAHQEAHA
jgi:hypothetical protein